MIPSRFGASTLAVIYALVVIMYATQFFGIELSLLQALVMDTLDRVAVESRLDSIFPVGDFRDQRVLLIVPDSTRTAPLSILFPTLRERLAGTAKSLDVLVALGTHPPMQQDRIREMLGIGREDPCQELNLFNHEWDNPDALVTIGVLSKQETEEISEGMLKQEVAVQINRRILDCDVALVVGPVFPHEVVGFSGGNKYFFPGVSGPDILHFFHWLGALISNIRIIGIQDTPVRHVVDRAAQMIPVERRCLAFVVAGDGKPYDLFYGAPEFAWQQAAAVSAKVHIRRCDRPFWHVLSCAPTMYDELWVAGKCMYKLEPVVADGGELIIYAPHMKEISVTHGALIRQVGYHVRDYFTQQWERFRDYPWGVLAHSSHVRGAGTFEQGIEKPRITVTLASQIPQDVCREINLSWRDPDSIDLECFANREHEGVLLVRNAGEQLYRLGDRLNPVTAEVGGRRRPTETP